LGESKILMKILIKYYPKFKNFVLKSEFINNVTILVSGTILAQIVPVLIQPLLRRIYSPAEFGTFAVYYSLIGVLSVISTFRYELAIVLPKKDKEAINILSLSIIINLITNLTFFLVILIFHNSIVDYLKFPKDNEGWLFFLPLSVFLFSCYQIINYWLIRKKSFKAQSINKISRRIIEGAVQIIFGLIKIPYGLVMGDVFGNIANNISGGKQLSKNQFSIKEISKTKMIFVAKKFKEMPIFSVLPAFLNTASFAIPLIIMSTFYSKTTVGYFDLTRQILAVPSAFITISISQILFQRISEKKNNLMSVKKDILTTFVFLSLGGILFITIIELLGPFLFKIYAGNMYEISGEYARIVVINFTFQFIISPLSVAFIPLGKLKLGSLWQIFYFCLICILFWFKDLEFENFLKVYVVIDIIAYSVYLALIVYTVKSYEKKLKFDS